MQAKTITSFKSLSPDLERALELWKNNEAQAAWDILEQQVLLHRVKFPILEKVAIQIKAHLDEVQLEALYTRLAKAKHESCYPVIGKLLQLELSQDLKPIYRKAIKHIIEGDKWYVCDIISERVYLPPPTLSLQTLNYLAQIIIILILINIIIII